MKDLFEMLNEAKEVRYDVQFISMEDSVKIMVPANLVAKFDAYLEKEEGNVFQHVSSETIEY
jgi:hypothetical protein